MDDTEQPKPPPTNNPADNPITRIPPDIEQRVGAPKNYADMTVPELQSEYYRLSIIHDMEDFGDRRLAGDKLGQAIGERREKDRKLLQTRL